MIKMIVAAVFLVQAQTSPSAASVSCDVEMGRVVIACDIDLNSVPQNCQVLEEDPPGCGFGAAALPGIAKARLATDEGPAAGGSARFTVRMRNPNRLPAVTDPVEEPAALDQTAPDR